MIKDIADVVSLLADLSEGGDVLCGFMIFDDLSWRITRNSDGEMLAEGENIFIDIRDTVSRARLFDVVEDSLAKLKQANES